MIIKVIQSKSNKTKAILEVLDENNICLLRADAFIGANGTTENKKEGDKKTPIGLFNLGLCFGTHKDIKLHKKIKYIELNNNLYWVDDISSKYYNMLVDITKVEADWKSAEHLIDYQKQYEYAVEIKANPNNIKGKGSAIFLHCTNEKPTAGCIAIKREYMIKLCS